MKRDSFMMVVTAALCASVVLIPLAAHASPFGQTSAVTYQGVLKQSGAPVNSSVDLQFTLFDAASGGNPVGTPIVMAPVTVSDGVFTIALDFGLLAFNGQERWLEIAVDDTPSPGGVGPYITLTPRQKITGAPYANYALNASLPATYANAVNFNNPQNTFSGEGAGLANLSPANLAAGTANISITGSAASAATSGNVTGIVAVANGGTGASNAGAALTSLGAAAALHSHTLASLSGSLAAAQLPPGGNWAITSGNLHINTSALFVNGTNDRVGIGTTVPADQLHVRVNSATAAGVTIENGAASGDAQLLIRTLAGVGREAQVALDINSGLPARVLYDGLRLRFLTDDVVRMEIDDFGNVGIGTNGSPVNPLHVLTSATSVDTVVVENDNPSGIASIRVASSNPSIGPRISLDGATPTFSAIIKYDDDADGDMRFVLGGAERMVLTDAGNLGLGVTAPLAALQVRDGSSGTIAPHSNASVVLERNSNNYLQMYTPDADEAGILFGQSTQDIAGALMFNSGGNPDGLQFRTGGNFTRMVIDDAGNVGIGVLAPTHQLELSTNSAAKPTSGSWTIFSDRRLKKNIRTIDGALDQLLQLRGVRYQWKDPASQGGMAGTYTGMIAQEVEPVFPEWVSQDARGLKSLTVIGFEGLAVEALRDLRAEKDAEIAALRNDVESLRAIVQQLLQTENRK